MRRRRNIAAVAGTVLILGICVFGVAVVNSVLKQPPTDPLLAAATSSPVVAPPATLEAPPAQTTLVATIETPAVITTEPVESGNNNQFGAQGGAPTATAQPATGHWEPGCPAGAVGYEHDGPNGGAGESITFTESTVYIENPWHGRISWLNMPEGCRGTGFDVVDENRQDFLWNDSDTYTFEGGRGYNLQAIERSHTPAEWIENQTCDNGLTYCWSDALNGLYLEHEVCS